MEIMNLLIVIPFGLGILAGLIALEIVLAKFCKSCWPGLILPALTFICSLLITVLLMLNLVATSPIGVLTVIVGTFLAMNIPTAVLLLIYYLCRRKFGNKKQVEKMNIQDL